MFGVLAPFADIMLAVCQFVLSAAVIPTVWAGRKVQGVPLTTSLMMVGGMVVMFMALSSRGLALSATSCILAILVWSLVAVERIRGHNAR